MLKCKKIKIANKYVEAISLRLCSKSLIILKGKKGYIMCGYLNLKAAEKFNDVAVKVVSVSSIADVLNAKVAGLTTSAKKAGILKGESIKSVLKKIA